VGGDDELFENVTRMIEASIQRLVHEWDAIRDRFYHSRRLTVALGADHRGYEDKERVKKSIAEAGYSIIDCGTNSEEPCDHPDYALRVAQLVSIGQADRGVLICGSGHGMVVSANKALSVRAVYPINEEHAKLSRQHNNANVLALGAGFCSSKQMESIILTWLNTLFLGGKYQRRNNKITDFERIRHLPISTLGRSN
jgi:RpiB/LacA/LacB family sugar-phosphate isomerase